MIHGLILAYLSQQYLGDIFSSSNESWNAKFGPVLTKLSTIYLSSATKCENAHLNCTLYITLMENVSRQFHRCNIGACYSTSSALFWPFKLKLHIFPSSLPPKCDDLALKYLIHHWFLWLLMMYTDGYNYYPSGVLGKYYLDDLDIIDKPKIALIGLLYYIQLWYWRSDKRKSLIHHIEDLSKRFDTYPEGVEEMGYQIVNLMV